MPLLVVSPGQPRWWGAVARGRAAAPACNPRPGRGRQHYDALLGGWARGGCFALECPPSPPQLVSEGPAVNIHGKRPVPGGSGGQAATPGPLLTGTKGAPAPGVAGAGGGGGLPREPPARGRRGLPSPPRSQRQPVFLHIFAYGEAARRVSSAPARLAGQSRRGQGSPAAAARSAPRPVPRALQRGRPRRGLRPARPGPPSSTAIATSLRHPLLSGGPRRAGPPWPTAALSPWRRSARGTGPRRRGYRQRHGSGTSRAGHLHRAALPPPTLRSGPAAA